MTMTAAIFLQNSTPTRFSKTAITQKLLGIENPNFRFVHEDDCGIFGKNFK